jgi:glucose-6-phosphate 1-dehydrogenase
MALVAMEPPNAYDPDSIRREKIKLLQAVREIETGDAPYHAALGRYGATNDESDEDEGLAYVELDGVEPDRCTETYSAMRLDVENWRWSGVPFYVRSGKKMASKLTEVVIQLKKPPANLFQHLGVDRPANRIVINIAPTEGISLRFEAKVPGPHFTVGTVEADMSYPDFFESESVEAYGPLMLDAMRGDQTLFKHRDEVEGGWSIVEPFLKSNQLREAIEEYAPYSWGPECADNLLARDGRRWKNG